MQPQSKKAFNRKQRRDPLLHPPPHFETVSQYRKGCMCRPRVISNAVRNLRSLTFVRDDNLMFSTLRHSLFLRGTIAGVGPRDKDGKLVAPGDFAAYVKQTWENLR